MDNSYEKYNDTTPIHQYNSDLYIVEFPKSGITWMSHILVNVFLLQNKSTFRASYYNLEMFVGDIHINKNIVKMDELPFRMIKSHSPYNPHYRHMLYLIRNPFDVMRSYYIFTMHNGSFKGDFSDFIKHDYFGVENYIRHIESWLKPGNRQLLHLVRYEDLRKDPVNRVKKLLLVLGYHCEDEIISEAVRLSQIELMRRDNELYRESCPFKKYTFVGEGQVNAELDKLEDEKYIFNKTELILEKYFKEIYRQKIYLKEY